MNESMISSFESDRVGSHQQGRLNDFSVDSADWNELVCSLPDCDVYDTAEYHRIALRHQDYSPRLFWFEEEGYRIALPLILRPIPPQLSGNRGWIDASSVYGLSGPFANCDEIPEDVSTSFQDSLKASLLERGVVSVFSRLNPFRPSEMLISRLGNVSQVGKTVVIDLTCSDEMRFRRYRKNHQDNICRLRELRAESFYDSSFSYFAEFESIYLENMARLNVRSYYKFDSDYFNAIPGLLGEFSYFFVNQIGGMVTCGALFLKLGDYVHLHLVATRENFRSLAPLKQLIDDAASFFRGQECRLMHIGGGVGGRADSLFHFKTGFSRLLYPFAVWKWVVDDARYQELCCAGGAESDLAHRAHFPCYRCRDDVV